MKFSGLRLPSDEPGADPVWGALWRRLSRYWNVIRIERAPRQMHVRETLQIGEKRQLLVVEVGERQLLIGAAGNCLTMLAELERYSDADPEGRA